MEKYLKQTKIQRSTMFEEPLPLNEPKTKLSANLTWPKIVIGHLLNFLPSKAFFFIYTTCPC